MTSTSIYFLENNKVDIFFVANNTALHLHTVFFFYWYTKFTIWLLQKYYVGLQVLVIYVDSCSFDWYSRIIIICYNDLIILKNKVLKLKIELLK